ncbi:MAG TPA: hypothetical protein PKK06_04070 [Phycisphaerae bacterium]|nr:hypothetical protein [Phycisphaerae bacterium]HNU44881.1 hypothetical protein [Phycisphaerae bacterium]
MLMTIPMSAAGPLTLLAADPSTGRTWGDMGAGQLLLVALVVVFTTITLIRTRQKIRERQRDAGESVKARYERLTAEQRQRQDLDQAVLQLDELARQVSALLDTKYAKVEAVLREADRRIAQLNALLQASPGPRRLDLTLDAEPPDALSPVEAPPRGEDPRQAAVYRLADEGKSATEIARQVDQPVGEVELILALRRARQAQLPEPLPVKV